MVGQCFVEEDGWMKPSATIVNTIRAGIVFTLQHASRKATIHGFRRPTTNSQLDALAYRQLH